MKKLMIWAMMCAVSFCFVACGRAAEAVEQTSRPAVAQTEATEAKLEESDWSRFRDYLQEHGDFVEETDRSTEGKYLVSSVAIKGKENTIRIIYKCESIVAVKQARACATQNVKIDLSDNAQEVLVEIQYEVSGTEGKNSRVQSCDTTYVWNVASYEEGDEITFTADYTDVDGNGKSLKKEGTMLTLDATRGFGDITDALRKALAESGLGITMADLGFVNY